MTFILYDEILPELRYVADELEDSEITYRAFNKGRQFNAQDMEGIWHSFYSTTGTVVLHASNNRNDRRTKTFRNQTLEKFIKAMKFKDLTRKYFISED